jgi:hypothetical protein
VNSKEVRHYIKHPAKLQKAEADALMRVTQEYPYSGLLHALYLKALKNQNNYLYPKQLKRTAISVPDRKMLYTFIAGEVDAEALADLNKPTLVFKAEETEKPVPESALKELSKEHKPETIAHTDEPVSTPAETAQPKPKVVTRPAKTTKTEDLDLAALPASVRETVLRARKVREQIGTKYDDPGKTPKERAVAAKPEPLAEDQVPVDDLSSASLAEKENEPTAIQPQKSEPDQAELIERQPEAHTIPDANARPETDDSAHEPIPVTEHLPEPVEKTETPDVEMHSFLDWLTGSELPTQDLPEPEPKKEENAPENRQVEEPIAEKPSTEQVKDLYDSFMEIRPKPKLSFRAEGKPIDASGLSTSPYAQYITETLAQIYVEQKLYDRALHAYEILRLKYPEKSSFFAGRMAEIKQILNENS